MGKIVVQTAHTMHRIAHADPLTRVPAGLKQLYPALQWANDTNWIIWGILTIVVSFLFMKVASTFIAWFLKSFYKKIYRKISYYEFLSTFTANWLLMSAWDTALQKTKEEITDRNMQDILERFLNVSSLDELSPVLRDFALYSLKGVVLLMSLYRNNLTIDDIIHRTKEEGEILESAELPKILGAIGSVSKVLAMLIIAIFGMLPYTINILISLSAL